MCIKWSWLWFDCILKMDDKETSSIYLWHTAYDKKMSSISLCTNKDLRENDKIMTVSQVTSELWIKKYVFPW